MLLRLTERRCRARPAHRGAEETAQCVGGAVLRLAVSHDDSVLVAAVGAHGWHIEQPLHLHILQCPGSLHHSSHAGVALSSSTPEQALRSRDAAAEKHRVTTFLPFYSLGRTTKTFTR